MPQQYDQDGNPINRDNPYQQGDNGQPVPGYAQQGPGWLANAEAAQRARIKLTPEQLAAQEAARIEAERAAVIRSLRGIAEGRGKAYGMTMQQVGKGNQRIAALSASGKGGLNAGINAANAQAVNKSAGHQQGLANKADEIAQARGALGQAIAQGQDYNASQGQQVLDALRQTTAAQTPGYMQTAGQLGAAGGAVWSAYGQSGGQSDETIANNNNRRYNGR